MSIEITPDGNAISRSFPAAPMTEHDPLIVTEEDRDAAWPFRPEGFGSIDRDKWDSGLCDHNQHIQAFARHRIAAEQRARIAGAKAGVEAAARLVWAASENCRMDMLIERYGDGETSHARDLLEVASADILALDPAAIAGAGEG